MADSQRRMSTWPRLGLAVLLGWSLAPVPGAAVSDELGAHSLETLPGLPAEAAALMLHGVDGGSLALAASVVPDLEEGPPGDELWFSVLVELPTMVDSPDCDRCRRIVAVYALDGAGSVVGNHAVTADLGGDRWPETSEGFKVLLRVGAGKTVERLRVLAVDDESGRWGLTSLPVTRPGGGDAPWLLPPRFPEPCQGWVGLGLGDTARHSARPVLVGGRRYQLESDLIAMAGAGIVRVALDLWPRAGGETATVETAILAARRAADGTRSSLRLELVVPPDLPRGIYDAVLKIEPAGAEISSIPAEVWILSEDLDPAGTECASWAKILSLARGGSSVEPVRSGPQQGRERRRKEKLRLRTTYARILRQAVENGDLNTAAAELRELEGRLRAERVESLVVLRTAIVELAADLHAVRESSLLPLVRLHAEAYGTNFAARRFALATHSRKVVELLAEVPLRADAGPEAEALARELSLVALLAADNGAMWPARRLSARAVELAPVDENVLTVMAVCAERAGEYRLSLEHLERVVAINAKNMAARLRLAVMEERIGREAEAERQLRSIVAEGSESWVSVLAAQRLARLLIRQERAAEAASLLASAAGRFPSSPRLRLQLAYALDRLGRRAEAAAHLAALPRGGSHPGRTARARYADSPERVRASLGEQVAGAFRLRLAALGAALDALPDGSAGGGR